MMNYPNTSLLLSFLLALFTFLAETGYAQESAELQTIAIRILDENGNPTPARVRFSGLDGKYYPPQNHEANFPITNAEIPVSEERDVMLDNNRRFAYVEGAFEISLPKEAIHVEVVKGYAYEFVNDTLSFSSGEPTIDIQLEKWFQFPDRTWYSGDVHVHYINPESAMLEMKAEDINVCNLLTSDFTVDEDLFRGAPEPISEPEHILYINQEYREDRLGHINLLNLKSLIQPVKPKREHQYPLNITASDAVHAQGGHVSWAHFAAWPGLEGPLGLVLKKVDAVELLCTIDPFQAPIFAPDVIPEVQMNSGLRLWYRLLNCGLEVPATAGTDKMNNQVTVGANRVFADVAGDFNYQRWIDALNEGRTFISNSPFIFCQIDGNGPGEIVQLKPNQKVKITTEVWSQLPVDRLEIIANGVMIAEKAISSGEHYAQLEIEYTPDESTWIAARAYQFNLQNTRSGVSFTQRRDVGGGTTQLNHYFGTLRPETTFAHTSPTYVLLDNQPIRSQEDAEYFAKYLENAKNWLDTSGSFPSAAAKQEVLEAFEKGKQTFLELGK
jgi:hypothetical protein